MLPKRKRKRGDAIEGMPAYQRRLDRPGKSGLLNTDASDPGTVERKSGGRLTAAERHALPSKDFALAGGRYPIENASHARNALARVSQHGSAEEKAKVRAAVHRKYPGMGRG